MRFERVLGPSAPGDIADHAAEEFSLLGLPGSQGKIQREVAAIFPSALQLQGRADQARFTGGAEAFESSTVSVPVALGHEKPPGLAQHLFFGVAEDRARTLVPKRNSARGIRDDDRIMGGLGQGPKAFFAFAQLLL